MDRISTCHNSARFSFGVGGKAELREMWSSSLDKTNDDYSLINYRSHKSTSSLFLVTIPKKEVLLGAEQTQKLGYSKNLNLMLLQSYTYLKIIYLKDKVTPLSI
jgi:hypothetical protein